MHRQTGVNVLEYISLYPSNVTVLNKYGSTAVCTLWTPPKVALAKLEKQIDMSDIAVVGTLYGNGVQELLCNLLYNPQINQLIICGKDLGGSEKLLVNFFGQGTSDGYICGTRRKIHHELDRSLFDVRLVDVAHYKPIMATKTDRITITLPKPTTTCYPSNTAFHQVAADTALDCWSNVVKKVLRFGVPVELKKGKRIELLNMRATFKTCDYSQLTAYGLDEDQVHDYVKRVLSPELLTDVTYSYGNRILAHYGTNTLDDVVHVLKNDPENRSCYISVWDQHVDGRLGKKGHPCLVSLFFRRHQQELHLTCVFRTHNAGTAWPLNAYGMHAIGKYVEQSTGIQLNAVTIISNSITIDPLVLDIAQTVAGTYKPGFEEDPNGNLLFDVVDNQIVARHYHDGQLVAQYIQPTVRQMAEQLLETEAISTVGHALWIGQELERLRKSLTSA